MLALERKRGKCGIDELRVAWAFSCVDSAKVSRSAGYTRVQYWLRSAGSAALPGVAFEARRCELLQQSKWCSARQSRLSTATRCQIARKRGNLGSSASTAREARALGAASAAGDGLRRRRIRYARRKARPGNRRDLAAAIGISLCDIRTIQVEWRKVRSVCILSPSFVDTSPRTPIRSLYQGTRGVARAGSRPLRL
jgi:hypothetical protein